MSGHGASVPALVFDDDDLPGDLQFEIFHDTTAPLFTTSPSGSVAQFRAAATDYLVDDLMVSTIRFTPQVLRRAAHHVAGGDTDWIGVLVARSGGMSGESGRSTNLEIGVGQVTIIDLAHPFAFRSDGADLVWGSLPRDRVPNIDRLGRREGATSWGLETPEGRAIAATVVAVADELPTARLEDASSIATRIAEVVDEAMSRGPFEPSQEALATSMRSFLRDQLDDLDLGIEALQRTFHCSRSAVYRLFESEGGVSSFIRRERLQRCYEELTVRTSLPRRVAEVATRWGFDNPSHFNRLFKSEFGATPSTIATRARMRGLALDQPGADASRLIEQFHDWALLG